MTELKPKSEQMEILHLLYKFRFLNRIQIQKLLKQKHFQRLILRLNKLTADQYIYRYYSPKTATIASVYSLEKKSRTVLKESEDINPLLLKRVYWEKRLSSQFKKHCLFLADIYLSLRDTAEANHLRLSFYTETDLQGMGYLISPPPDAFIALTEDKMTSRYFLDIFDEYTQWRDYTKRVIKYLAYFNKGYWQRETQEVFPEVILVCPNTTMRNNLNKYIQKVMADKNRELDFYLTSWNEIQIKGLTAEVLHKVT